QRPGSAADVTPCDGEGQGERAPTRLIKTLGRRCGPAGMAVSRAVALRGPGGLALDPPAGLVLGPGFRTTGRPAGASPWRGSLEAREPARSLELGMPATVVTGDQ